jgi:hypothetical protein
VLLIDSERGQGLAQALDESVTAEARDLAAFLAWAFGDATQAVIHYGSRAQGRWTRSESAFDFFVVVTGYGEAYRSLARTAGMHRSPRVATGFARILPPNVISLRHTTDGGERLAKVAVFSERDFGRETSERARDHFTRGRLMQHVVIAWARDAGARKIAVQGIVNARRTTFQWGRPFLPAEFSVEEFCAALLAKSLQGEIRPERTDHAANLVAAQRDTLIAAYGELLEELATHGAVERMGSRYALTRKVGAFERTRINLYFRISKTRNFVRLFKHVALYDGWMDYILEKIARSSGMRINVTERERRWPLIFAWPKFIRYLRSRPQRRD